MVKTDHFCTGLTTNFASLLTIPLVWPVKELYMTHEGAPSRSGSANGVKDIKLKIYIKF